MLRDAKKTGNYIIVSGFFCLVCLIFLLASVKVQAAGRYLRMVGNPSSEDGSFKLEGYSSDYQFNQIFVTDGEGKEAGVYTENVNHQNTIDFTFKVDDLAVGYYDMYATLIGSDEKVFLTRYNSSSDSYIGTVFPVGIYLKPTIKKNSDFFSTAYNHICFCPFFTVPKDSHTQKFIYGQIYFQLYDTKTKEWGDVYGPYDSYEKMKTQYFKGNNKSGGTKLVANRSYKVRAFYAKNVTYGSKTYPMIGPFSNEVTVKTGKAAKPKIKSVTVKAIKVKKIKLIRHAYWDINGKWIPYKESYTWTTKYKVTVKLKKKPGTAGLCIGNKRIKGNKKTYSATFTDTGKLKGKKIKVAICTYNDKATGAYGPAVYKKVKMK